MTVFLTPDLDPITGGTYFPPRDSAGSLGLPSVLRIVSENVGFSMIMDIEYMGEGIADALLRFSVFHLA